MPHSVNSSTTVDSGLICLSIMARFFGLQADPAHIKKEFALSNCVFGTMEILRAAKSIKLKVKSVNTDLSRLDKIQLPAIAKHTDGHYFVIAKISENKMLIQDPLEQRPLTIPADEFEKQWTGELILFTQRTSVSSVFKKFDFSWFIPEILKYKKLISEVLLASFFIQLLALATPLFFQVIIDKVLVHKGLTTLDVLIIGLVLVATFEIALTGVRTYLFSHTTHRIDVKLGANLFKHLLSLPISYFEARQVGQTVARVRELESIRQFITGSSLTLIVDLTFTFVFIVVMYYISPTLTYIVLAAIPFYLLLSVVITPILRNRLNEKFDRGAQNQAFLVESINGVETLKSMAIEPQMRHRWETQLSGYVKASFRADNLSNIASQAAGYINKITFVLILWFGAKLVITGGLTVGQLVAFNMLAGRVSGPILRLVNLWQDFQQAGISIQRLGDILNCKPEPGYNPGRVSLPTLKGKVTFDQVTFRYQPDGQEILRKIDIEINAGEVIGIVGRSGSGKSTLTKLIQRMYVPQSGRVLVDGVDLAMIEPAWLRRQIGVVMQDSFLFNRTVRDNIALSDPGVDMDAVVKAAKLAGAHDFILQLKEGYDTLIGEHGCNLSGGQKQRIAIARTLITNPKILIFDEATSALDYESEHIIQKNMREICRGRTVFIIAHRLSTIRGCGRIIVMDNGQVIETGSHAQLLEQRAQYYKLHQLQAGIPVGIRTSSQ